MWTSVPQMPARRTRMSTSLIPGRGASMSSSQSPGSRLLFTSAFMFVLLSPKFDILSGMFKIIFPMVLVCSACFAQLSPSSIWAVESANRYLIRPNITYGVRNNFETKLDIYQRKDTTGPQPTLMFIHGGGWTGGAKETSVMSLMPWLEMGWNVVNVEYRLARVALAPAAVEDCMCALRYVGNQAKTYDIDTSRIVVTGESAGGHLALTTGIIPDTAGFDRECAGVPLPKVAAIVNWFGITDVYDVIEGPHRANAAMQWFGSLPNREELARHVSPLTYV